MSLRKNVNEKKCHRKAMSPKRNATEKKCHQKEMSPTKRFAYLRTHLGWEPLQLPSFLQFLLVSPIKRKPFKHVNVYVLSSPLPRFEACPL